MEDFNQNQSFSEFLKVFEDFVDEIQYLISEEDWDEFNFYYSYYRSKVFNFFSYKKNKQEVINHD